MKILLLTIGSAGDVHPFIGLGLALKSRGHEIKIITNPFFGEIAGRVGLELVPLGTVEKFREALSDPSLWNRKKGHVAVFNHVLEGLRETYDAVANHYVPGETVLVSSSLGLGARIAQDKLNIPTATVHLSPAEFRSCIAPPKLPGIWMPAWFPQGLKEKIWEVGDNWVLDPLLAPRINAFRAELGLPPVSRILRDYWNSPQRVLGLFPEWYCPPQADWPPQTRLTGFPRYDESDAHAPDPALGEFLDSGEPPIVFTPGSAMYHGQKFFLASVGACTRLKRRGILLTRNAEQIPASLPENVRHFSYAPFSQLLPRAAALVHHGGVGTSAQAMAAACRQLITPFAHDQFDNADRLCRLGVGRTISSRKYTVRSAARELGALLADQTVTGNCNAIAARLTNDDAVSRTCDLIEALSPMTTAPVSSNR
jgi:rhamnosyltransferase subunit B